MYDQEIIFGINRNVNFPLTFKQFLILASGVGVSYYIGSNFESTLSYILILIVAIFTIVFVVKFKPTKITALNFNSYIENKKREMSPESYNRFIQRRIAEIQFQIAFRKGRGFKESEYLNEISGLLKNLKDNQQPTEAVK
jgi:hypothetical protein